MVHVYRVRWSGWYRRRASPDAVGVIVGRWLAVAPTRDRGAESWAMAAPHDGEPLRDLKRRNAFRSLWEYLQRG